MKKLTGFILALLCLLIGCSSQEPLPTQPNRIIVVCLDALRYDHLTPEITPNLYQLAQESVNYSRCYTSGSWTKPSIVSIFTGKWATYAGVYERYDSLPDDEETIAEIFQNAGWDTVGISGNVVIREEKGFAQGFNTFLEPVDMQAKQMIDTALEEIDHRRDEQFFLYLHLMDTHMPLTPPQPFKDDRRRGSGRFYDRFAQIGDLVFGDLEPTEGEVEQIRGLYEAEAAYADSEIGRFVETLREWELWEDTEFVFFADHGEELGDHGDWTHGHCLYDEVLHVPFFIRYPEGVPESNDELTSLADMGGLILESTWIDLPEAFEPGRVCYSEGVKRGGEQKSWISDDGWKLVWHLENEILTLFNLVDDPGELIDLSEDETDVVDELLAELAEIVLRIPEPTGEPGEEPSGEVLDQLRALGYVQ